jgi:hypothetical protein
VINRHRAGFYTSRGYVALKQDRCFFNRDTENEDPDATGIECAIRDLRTAILLLPEAESYALLIEALEKKIRIQKNDLFGKGKDRPTREECIRYATDCLDALKKVDTDCKFEDFIRSYRDKIADW